MWRRVGPWVKGVLLLLGVLLLVAAVLGALAKVEPDFYKQAAAVGPQPDDPVVAGDTETRLIELQAAVGVPYSTTGEWSKSFTAAELNAYLRESGADTGTLLFRPKLDDSFSDPRVSISGDRILIGARLGEGTLSTVVSLELKAWLIAGEPNAVALELVSVKAGVLPLLKQNVMDWLKAGVGGKNTEVKWYRANGNPVAVVRFRVNQPQPDMLLQTVSVADGRITIGGRNAGGP